MDLLKGDSGTQLIPNIQTNNLEVHKDSLCIDNNGTVQFQSLLWTTIYLVLAISIVPRLYYVVVGSYKKAIKEALPHLITSQIAIQQV